MGRRYTDSIAGDDFIGGCANVGQRRVSIRLHQRQRPKLQRLCFHKSGELVLDWRCSANFAGPVSIHGYNSNEFAAPLLSTALSLTNNELVPEAFGQSW